MSFIAICWLIQEQHGTEKNRLKIVFWKKFWCLKASEQEVKICSKNETFKKLNFHLCPKEMFKAKVFFSKQYPRKEFFKTCGLNVLDSMWLMNRISSAPKSVFCSVCGKGPVVYMCFILNTGYKQYIISWSILVKLMAYIDR